MYIPLTGAVPVRFWPLTVMLPLPPEPVTVEAVAVEVIEVEVEVVWDAVVDEDDDVVELDAVEADVELLEDVEDECDVDDDVVIGKVDVEE